MIAVAAAMDIVPAYGGSKFLQAEWMSWRVDGLNRSWLSPKRTAASLVLFRDKECIPKVWARRFFANN